MNMLYPYVIVLDFGYLVVWNKDIQNTDILNKFMNSNFGRLSKKNRYTTTVLLLAISE